MTFSSLAQPPIQPHEAEHAATAICRLHRGLICQTGDREGTVFFCPIGRQFWRYSVEQGSFTAPLRYPSAGVV